MIHPEINFYQGDCIPGMKEKLKTESCDLIITSIPFGALFSYSHQHADIGNNLDGDSQMHGSQFGLHMRFWAEEVWRVIKPGAMVCIHIQQLLRWKVQHGYIGMRDFRGSIFTIMENQGFQSHGENIIPNQNEFGALVKVLHKYDIPAESELVADLTLAIKGSGGNEIAIIKNPQNVARRLTLHSLMFQTAYKDSSKLAPAMNDYVLIFKKPGDREKPVQGIIEADRSTKLVEPSPIIEYAKKGKFKKVRDNYKYIDYQVQVWDEKTGQTYIETTKGGKGINPNGWFTKEDWIKWARGSWEDILEVDVLDCVKSKTDKFGLKENDEERHVCPLQKSVIRRFMKLYSNPGDLVCDPFMGSGTTGIIALEQERHCIGFELKESYHRVSCANLIKAKDKTPQLELAFEKENI